MGKHVYRVRAEDVISFIAALSGFSSIVFFLRHEFAAGCMLVFFAAFMDYVDGKLARHRGSVTEFGEVIDFLQDVVTYSISVGVLVNVLFESAPVFLASSLMVVASLFRLARQFTLHESGCYLGVPVVFNLLLPVFYLAGVAGEAPYVVTMLVLSFLMVSRIKVGKI